MRGRSSPRSPRGEPDEANHEYTRLVAISANNHYRLTDLPLCNITNLTGLPISQDTICCSQQNRVSQLIHNGIYSDAKSLKTPSIQNGGYRCFKYTKKNQTYLRQGAINKSQFQFLSFTASLIGPCSCYCVALNPIAIGTAKIRSSDTGAWRAAMGSAEFFNTSNANHICWRNTKAND